MIALDEDALICDLAETYQVYDYRSLPLKLVATLSAGLRDNSRIKLLMAGAPAPLDSILLASIADRIEIFRYSFSDNAKRGQKMPVSLVETLHGENEKAKGFRTVEEFEEALARIRRG